MGASTSNQGVAYAFIAASVISLVVPLIGAQVRTVSGYFRADGQMRGRQVAQLLFSSPFSLNGVLYQVWLGYALGWISMLMQVVWCLGYLLLLLYRSRIEELSRSQTLHGVIGTAFGQHAGKAAAVATIIGFVAQIGWELVIALALFGLFTNVSWVTYGLALLMALICAIYTSYGGISGNLRANTVQNALSVCALLALCGYLAWGASDITAAKAWETSTITDAITTLGVGALLSNVLFSLLWQFADMSTWQNLSASRQQETKKALVLGSLWIFFFPGVFGSIVGMYIRGANGLDPNTVLTAVLATMQTHPYLAAVIVTGLFLASFSTLDGLMLAVGQAFTLDILYQRKSSALFQGTEGREENENVLRVAKWAVVVFGLAGAALFLWLSRLRNIFDLVYIVTVAQMVLVPPIVCVLTGKRLSGQGFWAIVCGLAAGIALVVVGLVTKAPNVDSDLLPWAPVVALGISALVVLIPRKIQALPLGNS